MTCSAREGLCPLLYVLFFCIKVLQGKISLIFSCLTDQWCLSYMYMYKRQELEYTHILIQSYMYQLINSLMNLFNKRNCVKLCTVVWLSGFTGYSASSLISFIQFQLIVGWRKTFKNIFIKKSRVIECWE